MASHRLHRQPDRLTAVMAAITAAVLGLGVWGIWHGSQGNDPGHVCRPIPGTSRLDCG